MLLVWDLFKLGYYTGLDLLWCGCHIVGWLGKFVYDTRPCRCLALSHVNKLGPQHCIWPCLMRFWYKLFCGFGYLYLVGPSSTPWNGGFIYFARPCYIIPPDFRSLMNVGLYDDLTIILLDFEVYILWVCIVSIALVKHQVKKTGSKSHSILCYIY
jgi:hypothetical protein